MHNNLHFTYNLFTIWQIIYNLHKLVIGQCQLNAQQLNENTLYSRACAASPFSILKVFSLESFHGLWIFRAQMILWTQFWHLIIWDIFGQWEHIVFSGRERHLYSKGLFIALNNNFNRGIFREVAWIMDILSTNDFVNTVLAWYHLG